jgi:ketosteroid isomerase-like protein
VGYVGAVSSSGDTAASAELDAVVEESHRALDAFFKGDANPAKSFFSRRDDVTLANPFGPPRRGWAEVEETMERAAANYRDGGVVGFERVSKYVTPELAYIVEVEHYQAKVGGSDELTPVSLRCTTILRREDDGWKIVHRHADPITTARPAESVIPT